MDMTDIVGFSIVAVSALGVVAGLFRQFGMKLGRKRG